MLKQSKQLNGVMHEAYYICDRRGAGLHYIQGHLYWRLPDSVEAIENFTKFTDEREAAMFMLERKIPGGYISKLTFVAEGVYDEATK